ncbi:transglycosylase domain-containing protein, partial [Myxococcota bacterium]|nr:transglycosylase domain-containing protein [Myxococcota bacterium]
PPRFPKAPVTRKSGRSLRWEEIEVDGVWLELDTRYGKLSVEDGNGIYMRKKGGRFELERISLDSKKIPVYFIEKATVGVGEGKQISWVTLNRLVWKINDDLKLFTKDAQIRPSAGNRLSYEVEGRFLDNRGKLTAKGEYNRGEKTLDMTMDLEGARVGYLIPRRYPVKLKEQMTLSGKLHVVKTHLGFDIQYKGALRDVSVQHAMLADRPLDHLAFELDMEANYDHTSDTMELARARYTYRKVRGEIWGRIAHFSSKPLVHASFTVPSTPCQDVISSLPVALFPNVSRFKLKGRFQSKVTAKIDFSQLDKRGVSLGGRIDLDKCFVTYAPPYFRTTRLRGDFDFSITEPGGQRVVIPVDRQGDFFTPLEKISPYMVKAVLTTEDGRFFRHRGFITSEFSSALAKNLKAKRFKWGASSITMQVVKNVFLKRRKTLSRKLEELFLTWHVERYVNKNRLMEIYLNIIEVGPNMYGVTRGARHFFGKEPEELTLKEAIYFASLLPSPKKRYAYFCKGKISSYWNRYLNQLLKIMLRRGRITHEEYQAGIAEEITFDHTNFEGKYSCYRRIRRYQGY